MCWLVRVNAFNVAVKDAVYLLFELGWMSGLDAHVNGWFVNLNANYYDRIYLSYSPSYRYGEGKTPVSLVRSCSVFLYADRKESKAEENTPEFFIRRDMEYFDKAFEQAADGKEEVSLSLIGGALKKMMPKFKVRRYGCKTLGKLYEKLDRYELVMTEKGVANAVRLKY